MTEIPPHFENFTGAHGFQLGQQTINLVAGNQYLSREGTDLILRLNPVAGASHTRNRSTSPPDSACFPGTREGVIVEITSWGDASVILPVGGKFAHVYWFHGFAGSGKSAISLEIAKIHTRSRRLLASFFFYRNAGDRSSMRKFVVTLASQLAAAIPATASFIDAAVKAEPGLLTDDVSLSVQMERLVYEPFQAVLEKGLLQHNPEEGPFIIVIDGLDECEDKRGVEELIDHMLDFFKSNPSITLRVFIASRVEQHIRARLETDGVVLNNLDSHSPREDIEKYMRASFQAAAKRDRLIRAYIRTHGEWPTRWDMSKLVKHVKSSFLLASTILKFIFQPPTEDDPSLPMDRLPLTFNMNGLDSLYAQTLARSQHLPYFTDIISTLALLGRQLPIVGMAHFLNIEGFEVLRVLLNLQAIVLVPGSDEEGKVMLCHTSFRDFLTTESRSGPFFVSPSFHLHLAYHCFSSLFRREHPEDTDYARSWLFSHWASFVSARSCDFINEIERFKTLQPPNREKMHQHSFLCHALSYSLFVEPPALDTPKIEYMLTESVKQLALALECTDYSETLWYNTPVRYIASPHVRTLQFNRATYEALRCCINDVSAKLTILGFNVLPPVGGYLQEFGPASRWRPRVILHALAWILDMAKSMWTALKAVPHPPLKLTVDWCHGGRRMEITFE